MLRSLVLVLALSAAACGGAGAEQQILTNFFRAARVGDNVTLANVAAVTFDPRKDGTVQDFKITNIGPEQSRKLQLAQLMKEEEAARQAEKEFSTKKRQYQEANIKAIERVVKAESAKQPVKGQDAVIQTAWSKWREDQSASQRRISVAKAKVASERSAAVDSLTAPGRPDVDPTGMDVEMVTKDVTVEAQVKSPSGQTAPKTIVFTFQRATAKTASGETLQGRWMIVGLKQ